ncbi:MAG: c-type cytochrome [Limnohabitans sp.]
MSDQHEEPHTGPIKTPRQFLLLVVLSFILPVFVIIGLVYYITADHKPVIGASNAEEATAARIQKVGAVQVMDANRPLKSGEAVYTAQCAACHASGAAGAPKFGDSTAWTARIKTGYAALLNSSLKGKNVMPAQGGGEHSDTEIGRAVVYMANAAGAKFADPAPAAN